MKKIKCKYCGKECSNGLPDIREWHIVAWENSVCSNCEEKAAIDPDMMGTIGG